jgi:hypothetical protein
MTRPASIHGLSGLVASSDQQQQFASGQIHYDEFGEAVDYPSEIVERVLAKVEEPIANRHPLDLSKDPKPEVSPNVVTQPVRVANEVLDRHQRGGLVDDLV